MIKRMLAAAGTAALVSGVALSAIAASPTWAASSASSARAAASQRGTAGQLSSGTSTGLTPRAGEWWFTSWKILPKVWPLTEGAGVTVAVIDSGVQASVPDLRGAVLPGGDVTGHNTNGEKDFNTDGDGHGTMMSVLIAGQGFGTGMVGVAPKAKILPVTVNAGASDITSDPSAMAAGIMYAANHGARVIDVSQDHPAASAAGCDPAEQAAVAYALARDIVVIAAAGDTDLSGSGPSEPASCAGVLAVGAVQPNRTLWPGNAHQPYITVVNPGADLITSGRDGRLVTGVSGTRAASALAAGAVALIRSRYPALRWYQVIQRLTGTALVTGGQVPNDSFGYGILRLSEAVNATAFPVSASAPDPVYAKFQAWLATPQGRSVSRQIGASASGSAPGSAAGSSAGKGGSATTVLLAILIPLAVVSVIAAGLALRLRFRPAGQNGRKPGRNGQRLGQNGRKPDRNSQRLGQNSQKPDRNSQRLGQNGRKPDRNSQRLGQNGRKPGRNGLRKERTGAAFPDLLSEISEFSNLPDLSQPGAYVPYPDLPAGVPPRQYQPLGEDTPYRVPPYGPGPDPGRYPPPPGDGWLSPGAPQAPSGDGRLRLQKL